MDGCESCIASTAGEDVWIGAFRQLLDATENIVANASAMPLVYEWCQH